MKENKNILFFTGASAAERLRIASDGKIGMGGATSPEELLDLGNALQINLKVGGRAYLGQGYSTAATILGHSVKAKTTGTVSGGMEVTETNSGGGAPAAMRMQSGNIEFHTAGSGTSGATFDSERLRIHSNGEVSINSNSRYDNVDLYVNNFVRLGNFFIGRVPGTANNNDGVILIGRVGLNFGIHFGGQITFNSYTGTGTRILDITTTWNDTSAPYSAGANGVTYSSGNVSRVNLKVAIGTVDSSVTESGSDETWLVIRKNANGTGTAQLNAFIQTNAYDHGGIREVAGSAFTQTQSIADVN